MAGVDEEIASYDGVSNLQEYARSNDENMFQESFNFLRNSKEKVNILLVGAPGAGKSSLINSLITMCSTSENDRIAAYIPTAPIAKIGGQTMFRESVTLTETVTIYDNRGWHNWGIPSATNELLAQINGLSACTDCVDWEKGRDSDDDLLTEKFSTIEDKITTLVLVINGNGGIDALECPDKLIEACQKGLGRRPLVVVTHNDQIGEKDREAILQEFGRVHGIDGEKIFFITNKTKNTVLDVATKSRLGDFIMNCLHDGKRGNKFHVKKEATSQKIASLQSQKEAQKQQEEVANAAHELEVTKSLFEKMRLEREAEKQNAIAGIEEEMKQDERKHKLKMQLRNERSIENKDALEKEQKDFKLQQEKEIAEIEKQMTLDKKDHARKMHAKEEENSERITTCLEKLLQSEK